MHCEGLKIMKLEHKLALYPVLRLDISTATTSTPSILSSPCSIYICPHPSEMCRRKGRQTDAIYVFELKVHDMVQHALEQIDDLGYAIPFKTDNRSVVEVGVKFNIETRAPEE